jgi:tetratricopeptide (TPR) repeat protein
LIWAIGRSIQNTTELEDWIATLEYLTIEQRERAFSTRTTEAGCLLVAEQLWMREAEKPEVEQDWQAVLTATQNLAESSSNLGLELLWTCAVCSEVVILAEYRRDLSQAIAVTESAIAHASDDPRVQFLLKECLGRQFVFANRHNEAITWLTQALAQPTEAYPSLRLYAFLRLSRVIADQEPYLAIQYAQQAVNLARSSEDIPEADLVKTLGELAIAKWLTTGLPAAFEAWDQAGEYLLNSKPITKKNDVTTTNSATRLWENSQNIFHMLRGDVTDLIQLVLPAEFLRNLSEVSAQSNSIHQTFQSNKRIAAWKDLFVMFAHMYGYFTTLATKGSPPNRTETGETYAAPTRGIFLTRNSARADYYNPSRDCFLPAQLASLAEAIGNDERALVWAMRGVDMASSLPNKLCLVFLL